MLFYYFIMRMLLSEEISIVDQNPGVVQLQWYHGKKNPDLSSKNNTT